VIRILHVIDTLKHGGAERSLLDTTSRMDRTRFQPLVCPVYPGEGLKSEFVRAGIGIRCLDVQAKYGFVTAVRRLIQLIHSCNIDLIHSSLFRAGQAARVAARLTGCPVVSSLTNTPYSAARVRWDTGVSVRKLDLLRRLDSATARWVNRFHAVSESVANQNCRDLGISRDRVSVVYRGRDIERFAVRDVNMLKRLRNELRLPDDSPILLNIGRLVPQKGQRQLVGMMQQLVEQFPLLTLLIAGAGPERETLENMFRTAGVANHVRVLGTRDDVPDLLQLADVFVFPSHYEGLPGALVEAMLSGTPVVASDIAMHREFLDDGVHGLLVTPSCSSAFTRAVALLLSDGQWTSTLAAAGQARARKLFDIRRAVTGMEELFEQAVCDCSIVGTSPNGMGRY